MTTSFENKGATGFPRVIENDLTLLLQGFDRAIQLFECENERLLSRQADDVKPTRTSSIHQRMRERSILPTLVSANPSLTEPPFPSRPLLPRSCRAFDSSEGAEGGGEGLPSPLINVLIVNRIFLYRARKLHGRERGRERGGERRSRIHGATANPRISALRINRGLSSSAMRPHGDTRTRAVYHVRGIDSGSQRTGRSVHQLRAS